MRLRRNVHGPASNRRSAVPAARALWPAFLLIGSLAALVTLSGCTRRFFRNAADLEVSDVLSEKNVDPRWQLDDYNVYPNPLARFADWTNPDRPPMPPDDPAAWFLAPKPQKPREVAWIEGHGYLELLTAWDFENRARGKQDNDKPAHAAMPNAGKPANAKPEDKPAEAKPQEAKPEPAPGLADPCASRLGYLGGRKEPFLITLEQALELAVVNSREFQNRREDLYLSALPVTLDRFAFAPQFDAVNSSIREWAARESSVGRQNRWRTNSSIGASKLFSTGALLTAQLANRTVINLTGNQKHTLSDSTLVLDLVQPFLRGGGRAVTLEPLTQSERDLLYEMRDYAHFHKEFFVAIAAGGGGLQAGGGGDFGGVQLTVEGQAASVGYYPTLLQQARYFIQLANQQALNDLFTRYQAYSDSNVVAPLEVGQVEQSLRNADASVIQADATYQNNLDQFKIQLGLPTELPLLLEEPPGLKQLREKIDRVEAVVQGYRTGVFQIDQLGIQESLGKRAIGQKELRESIETIFATSPLLKGTPLQQRIQDRWSEWKRLYETDRKAFDQRLKELRGVQQKLQDEQRAMLEKEQPFPPEKAQQLAEVSLDIELALLEVALKRHEERPWEKEKEPEKRKQIRAERFSEARNRFSLIMTEAEVQEARRVRDMPWPELPSVLVNGLDLLAAGSDAEYDVDDTGQNFAGQTALENRLDLMNQRAEVVDSWRNIKVFANSLMGVFDVRYNMEVLTPPPQVASQPLNFDGKRARHQLILNSELPLVRKLERNNYRATLIGYQRQRRSLMATEDQILFQVRQHVRELRRLKRNYEIQQRALQLAYIQVDNGEERLLLPPAPGEPRDAATAAAANTQTLLNGINAVPRAKNDLFQAYVTYLTRRMQLYRDLELMQIDSRGVWIDEYATNGKAPRSDQPPCWP